MYADEVWTGEENGKRFGMGNSGIYETYTDEIRRLFDDYQREYGPCSSSVYVTTPEGDKRVGWVFRKRVRYTDSHTSYTQFTWVTLHDRRPEPMYNNEDDLYKEYHYHELN